MKDPINSDKMSGAVAALLLVKIKANKYSFQAKIAVKITAATIPGADSGIVIFKKA